MPEATPQPGRPTLSRREKVLRQEVLACDDPICCCEAEPRWLRLQHDQMAPSEPSEWECLNRAPSDEL